MTDFASTPLEARAFYQDFVAEGSRAVNTEILAGLHAGFGERHAVLTVHDRVHHDGLDQPMQGDRFYRRLVDAYIPVTTLGRNGGDRRSDDRPFTDQELDMAARHARNGHVIMSLEEYPLALINSLDPETTPPLVTFLHRTEPLSSPYLPHLKTALGAGRIAMCVVDSQAASRVYQEVGVPEAMIKVIPNGIDLDRFTPSAEKRDAIRSELGIPADAPTVLFPSRFSDEKDVPLFVESARHYLASQPDGHLVMAGAGLGAENPGLDDLIDKYFGDNPDLTSRLHRLGIRFDIDAIHAAADVVALTSRTESYPLSLLEGMASGSIPVSTDVGDARIMIEGRGIVTSREPEEIAAAWQEAYVRRAELAITAEQRQEMGKQRMLQAYDALLRSVARR